MWYGMIYDMIYDIIWYYDMIWWYDTTWYDMQLGSHPVAAVQYTLTHNRYTEQHKATDHTEQNIHNDKNT
jgi:hypothetical protein